MRSFPAGIPDSLFAPEYTSEIIMSDENFFSNTFVGIVLLSLKWLQISVKIVIIVYRPR